jgi:hypothetical protein
LQPAPNALFCSHSTARLFSLHLMVCFAASQLLGFAVCT